MSFRWTSMSLKQVTFSRDEDNAVTVLVLGAGGGSGGGGAATFLQLTDTPAAYTGQAGRGVRVNAGATGLEFFALFGGAFADLTGIPTTLAGYGITDAAGLVHAHVIADVTGLQAALDAKAAQTTVTALVATVNAQSDAIDLLDTELDGKAAVGHTHDAGATISGVFGVARLGTGTAGSGTFLRGDGTWAALPGGSASWGAITGTLADQTDLQTALNNRLLASAVSAFGLTLIDDADAAAGRTTLGLGGAAVLNVGTGAGTVAAGDDARLSDARTPTSHTHGNLTNAGAIGATSGVPIITGASGVLQAGSFGTAAGTFCQGNDSRLNAQTITLTGNVTGSGTGSFAATIANNAVTTARIADDAVTLAKLANIATNTLIGRATAGTGDPETITCTAAGRALLDDADAAAQRATLGAAPADIALGEIVFNVDGGGAAAVAVTRRRYIRRACVITSAAILADVSGSVTVTIKRDRGGTVTTIGTVTLSSAAGIASVDISGWSSLDLAVADILVFEGAAATTIADYALSLGRRAA